MENKVILRRIKNSEEVNGFLRMKYPDFYEYMSQRSDEYVALSTPDRKSKEDQGVLKDLIETEEFEVLVDETGLYLK